MYKYQDIQITLTGSSGFLGQFLSYQLRDGNLVTVGRSNSSIICDLSTEIPQLPPCNLVIHSAGKAHSVPKTPQQKQEFFDVNVRGTQNLLRGLEQSPDLPKAFVFISSVSVYGLNKGINVNENHPLNAKDPYGLSKIQAEEIVRDWCTKNNVICTILRLPLLVGQNPPGNLGSMIRGIQKGYYFNIADGNARKSMVMADDVARFILPAGAVGGIYNLTDGYHPNFNELSRLISRQLGKNAPGNIPYFLSLCLAKAGDILGSKFPVNSSKLDKITSDLTFDDSNARKAFNWNPGKVLDVFEL